MKLNISYPETGKVLTVEVDDEKRLVPFYEKRLGNEVPADSIGEEWQGYLLRITGGNDKQGFPMLQGVFCNHRVRLLMRKGMKCFRERRKGCPKRKSVRGCIVASDISALNLCVVEKGAADIAGLTDEARVNRLGPKRANHIRKTFDLPKSADVRKFVVRRQINEKTSKAPKIQRLVTAERLARKQKYRAELAERSRRSQEAAAEYKQVIKAYKAQKLAAQAA
uniref:40S ribosomal protein S6 n=1 Tax=Dermatophagoides pteronyssinus TaxID=6956 RepID=A0A6P6Y9T8_DERPT|nr:40S ribosomal protein S6-like [Dermatophagoides pteronyssinus]